MILGKNQFSPVRLLAAILFAFILLALPREVSSHRSGCHRWHSCPSDRGTYVCGDRGYCSQCPDNQYCLKGRPRPVSQQQKKSEAATSSPTKGVAPVSAWECPGTHPIKGNFTTSSGERCIYHVPGGQFYNKTKPERCYASRDEANVDGCRASKR